MKKIILGLSLTLCVSLFLFLCSLKISVFNKHFVYSLIEKNNYVEKIKEDMDTEVQSYLSSIGIQLEIMKNVYQKTEVKKDIHNFVDNFYNGKTISFNKNVLKKQIHQNIVKYLKDNNLHILNSDDFDLIEDNILNIYHKGITLYGYFDNYSISFSKINQYIIFIIMLLFGIIIFLFWGSDLSFCQSSIIGSGIILLFIYLIITEKMDLENLFLISNSFSNVLKDGLFFNTCLIFVLGIGIIIVGVLLSLILKKAKGYK